MKVLKTMTYGEAASCQFRLVDAITRHFGVSDFSETGSLGSIKSHHTRKVEGCLADFFDVESCLLIHGGNSAALRWALYATIEPKGRLLTHKGTISASSLLSIENMALRLSRANFNSMKAASRSSSKTDAVFIQHTRHHPDDRYDLEKLLQYMKEDAKGAIIVDDTDSIFKVSKIGVQFGADCSFFSLSKVFGPEGMACILGKKTLIDKIRQSQETDELQVSGHQASEALQDMVKAPVSFALQNGVIDGLIKILNTGVVPFVKSAEAAHDFTKTLQVQLKESCALALIKAAEKLGVYTHPTHSNSRYAIAPAFYRLPDSIRKENPSLGSKTILIKPNQSGAETIIRILKSAYSDMDHKH